MKRALLLAVIAAAVMFYGCMNIEKDETVASFTVEETCYELHLCEGEKSRLAVYVEVLDKEGNTLGEESRRDVKEPLENKVETEEIYIEGTGMKFVYGKAFGKRFKPYLNGEAYGRLDQNNMFFYAVKADENVDIVYR